MKRIKFHLQKLIFLFLVIMSPIIFSFSQAQHMFYHLLPGFTPAFVWVGLGGDANWNTPENWSTNAVPGLSDMAIFDDTCVANCDPLINVAISIGGLNIKNTYAGTITQDTGQNVVIGASGWTQAAGNFVGSDAAITVNGAFAFSGGQVTATSGTWTQAANFSKTGGVFNHNNGLWTTGSTITISPDGMTLYNVTFSGNGNTQNLNGGTLNVSNNLILDATTNGGDVNNGTINLSGNLLSTGNGKGSSALIRFIGAGAQSLTGSSSNVPGIEINKPGGTLTITGTIQVISSWTWIAGTVDASASTLVFYGTTTVTPGPVDYNNITFSGNGNNQDLNAGTMKVLGTLVLDATSNGGAVNNGTISALGHINTTGNGKVGSALVKIESAGAQILNGAIGSAIPNVEINKSAGTLTITGNILTYGTWTWVVGAVDASASTITFIGTVTITPGPVNYNNIVFTGNGNTQNLGGQAMSVLGTLTFDATSNGGDVNNGTINAAGNVVFTGNGKGGTVLLNYVGTAGTTLTVGASASTLSTTHNVAKTGAGSLSIVANTSFASAGRNFTISSGTFNVAGFSFNVNSLLTISAGGRLLCNGGTATAGSWSINGEISCGTGQGITWTGLANDNLWSSAGNWTNNTIPGAADLARFNNSVCVGVQCDAQINSNLSVRGINLQSTYPGTLTQNTSRTLTIGAAGFTQAGGTFAGGDSAMTVNGVFTLSGGTHTATSATWNQTQNMTISGAPTFNHNSGTWRTDTTITIVPNGITLYNATFDGWTSVQNLSAGTMIILNTLLLTDTSIGNINNGNIELQGNLNVTGGGRTGSAIIKVNGIGAQSATAVGGNANIPSFEINKAGGALTMTGTFKSQTNWNYIAGTIDVTAAHLVFEGANSIIPGTMTYQNVTFGGYANVQNLNAGTMLVVGTLTLYEFGAGQVNNGTIQAQGDISLTGNGKDGTALIVVNGNGAQSLSAPIAGAYVPSLQINKPGGTLTFSNYIRTYRNLTHLSGTVDSGTSSWQFEGSCTIRSGSIVFNNVTFAGWGAIVNLNTEPMIVTGSTSLSDIGGGEINNGTLEARGNITLSSDGKSGNAILKINGSGAQALASVSASPKIPRVDIDKSAGTLTMSGTIYAGAEWRHTNGTVAAGTSTLYFNVSSTIIPNTMQFYNMTFAGWSNTVNLSAATLVVAGTLVLTDAGAGVINNGIIHAQGNVTVSGSKSGTADLTFNGVSSGTLTWTAGTFLTNNLIASKGGGASVILASNVNFSTGGRDFTIASGTLDLAGYDFSTQDVLLVDTGATLKCNGGEITPTPLTITNNGTINCPGYATYDFNWTGAGGNADWNNAGNWQGGVAPGASDVVVFQDTYCGGNCNATINVNSSIRGVRIFSPYTGTITQGAGNTVTIGARSWRQLAGTFTGSDGNMTVNLPATTGEFNLLGGTFNSTSGVLRIVRTNHVVASQFQPAFVVGAGATFNHNNGTLFMNCTETWNGNSRYGIDVDSTLTLYNLTFAANGGGGNGHYVANGDTVTVLNNFEVQSGMYNGTSGVIDLYGNLIYAGTGNRALYTMGTVRFRGSAAQTYSYSPGNIGPKIVVDKTGGTLTAASANAHFATLTVTNGIFTAPSGNLTIGIEGYNEPGNMTVMTLASPASFAHNNGKLIFFGLDAWTNNYQYTYRFNGTLAVNDAEFQGSGNSDVIIFAGDTLEVNGTATHTSSILQGNFHFKGNVAFNSTVRGPAVATFNGTGAQSISGSYPTQGHWTVNKAAGVMTLANAFNLNNAGQNLTITAGTLNMDGNNLTVANNISNSGTLQRGTSPICGTISQGGSFTGNAAVCP